MDSRIVHSAIRRQASAAHAARSTARHDSDAMICGVTGGMGLRVSAG